MIKIQKKSNSQRNIGIKHFKGNQKAAVKKKKKQKITVHGNS